MTFAAFTPGLSRTVRRDAITATTVAPSPMCCRGCWQRRVWMCAVARPRRRWRGAWRRHCASASARSAAPAWCRGCCRSSRCPRQEGVALMCLAEALLRIPDDGHARRAHPRQDRQRRLAGACGQQPLAVRQRRRLGPAADRQAGRHRTAKRAWARALRRVIGEGGEPLIRKGVDMAMRLMGEQFVTGETIAAGAGQCAQREAEGFRYSYDMLGEAAMTAPDAERYVAAYEQAIHAIGMASAGRGIYEGPGISIKLSALHPRYSRAQLRTRDGRAATRGCCNLALLARQLRHRPQHRRRRSRPAGAVAGPAGSACASSRRWPAGTASASSSRPTRSAARA